MYKIELTGGVTLSMPDNLSEISVSQYAEFLQGVTDFIGWQNAKIGEEADMLSPEYQLERLHRISAMVQGFCMEIQEGGVTLDQLFAMPVGNYLESLKDSFSIDSLDDLDLDRSEATLYTLWANIVQVVASMDLVLREDEVSFTWKGEEYFVKPMNRDRMTGRELPPAFSVNEAVEVLELRRKANALIETKKYETKNIKWELLHRQLAILAMKAGETLPADDLAFERFVSDRAVHFIGIDAETALKVDFFLGGQLELLSNTLTVISFSTLPVLTTWLTQKSEAA